MSPFVSVNAFLQSIIPALVISRSFATVAAVISAIIICSLVNLLCGNLACGVQNDTSLSKFPRSNLLRGTRRGGRRSRGSLRGRGRFNGLSGRFFSLLPAPRVLRLVLGLRL